MMKTVSMKENILSLSKGSFVYTEFSQIPDSVKKYMLKEITGRRYTSDYYTPMKLGKEWLYEHALKFQPKTGNILLNGGDLHLIGRVYEDFDNTPYSVYWQLFQDMGEYMIRIFRAFYGSNPEDPGYHCNRNRPDGLPDTRQEALPEAIRLAYHTRFAGLDLPREPFPGPLANYLLPLDLRGRWLPVRDYLQSLRLVKPHTAWLEERFPGITSKKMDRTGFLRFMICLDSRPTGSGLEGDVVFVNLNDFSGTMYLIHNGDVQNMRILADPVSAYDLYCEHILLRREGRFDFMPFTVPLGR